MPTMITLFFNIINLHFFKGYISQHFFLHSTISENLRKFKFILLKNTT